MGKDQRTGGPQTSTCPNRRASGKVAPMEERCGFKKLSDHKLTEQVGCRGLGMTCISPATSLTLLYIATRTKHAKRSRHVLEIVATQIFRQQSFQTLTSA